MNPEKPWGSKLAISIYVAGDLAQPGAEEGVVLDACQSAEKAVRPWVGDRLDFVGASIETVDERPEGQ